MEENYNWRLILLVSAPMSLLAAYIFYSAISSSWKWFLLIIALIVTGFIVYSREKKRSTVFTAVGIVFLAALVVRALKQFGFF
ncbi:hypothetical protein HYS31_06525 [Candidatus Woesearchaeota archaeon]|nr:hypothetical protein [Candidatus Woesearchaeota archaeon]